MIYFQQGDVLIKPVDTIKGKIVGTNLLWKGQAHHHRVKGNFSIYKYGKDVYLRSRGCTLFHEEHKDIKVTKGNYKLDIVVEYDHWLEESRQVID